VKDSLDELSLFGDLVNGETNVDRIQQLTLNIMRAVKIASVELEYMGEKLKTIDLTNDTW